MHKQNIHPSARLRLLRETLELSQRELAKEFHVSSGAIASWELGSNPIPGPVIRLMDLYELKLESPNFSGHRLENLRSLLSSFDGSDNDISTIQKNLNAYLGEVTLNNYLEGKIKFSIAKQLISFLNNSKGLTIKAAQLLSYLEIGLPTEIRLALGNLQMTLKPMSKRVLQDLIDSHYREVYAKYFQSLDLHPIAVTSLAQVHLGVLKSGEKVAVKIKSKDIEKTLKAQFSKLRFLQRLGDSSSESKSIFHEIERSILDECNYRQEAMNHQRIRNLIQGVPRTIVPRLYSELCNDHFIVTEFIEAQNFLAFCQTSSQAAKNVVAASLARTITTLAFKHNITLGDIHPENFLIKNDKVVYLDFGRVSFPQKHRMRNEILFYKAMLENDKERAKSYCKLVGFAKDESTFDFDEFYNFLQESSEHLLTDRDFKFTREYALSLAKKGRQFSHKKTIRMSPEAFWGFTFSAGTWALYAQLEAECNWRQIALDVFNDALRT